MKTRFLSINPLFLKSIVTLPNSPNLVGIQNINDFNYEYPLLEFSTFFGGSGSDNIFDTVVDSEGNIFITGMTDSDDFPVKNALQQYIGGERDIFLTKFSPDGQTLLFSTFLGGSDLDSVKKIALDPSGNIVLSGETYSPDFPIKKSQNKNFSIGSNVFVTKISSDGQSLLFSFPVGGNGFDGFNSMTLDKIGNIYILGKTSSTDLPLVNPFKETLNITYGYDHFITIISVDGTSILFSSYMGGQGSIEGVRIQMKLDES
ncbi:MAG: SBBP repeat-containing protein, partial [Candidatus Kariarchaeaceae archaeon]